MSALTKFIDEAVVTPAVRELKPVIEKILREEIQKAKNEAWELLPDCIEKTVDDAVERFLGPIGKFLGGK
ncbi:MULTISPECIES: hypothetical protein [Mycobacteroides]|uniref:hypothetical protein n=1 Tax=Mycobacteroides TaxID=670516 RepID=UPI0009921539|nr:MULTISPECIES: hypothetical protein [Mycobacteroides]SKK35978.1 Uncharacterised protein [Mycobacteroides abscessus subsp. massiliense]SKM34428.1 Uncharacterised protein [Mycobacteroides abscessus subsp. massiliense]SKP07901.1 Uncharacterised protein [Mycobacteroides abscessus subsp. massiliense]SKP93804.1 Uncharacterised protein [Mycobacteroides abscessus subsp. massiliense]SLK60026.1 Uncharacterised protein [Mycobacteroides abscessus subsp. massiliense]